MRQRRGERAFVFDEHLTHCLGGVEREEWEMAVSISGGDVCRAAGECGIDGAVPGVKALWGRSPEEAVATYRRWQAKRKR